MLAQREGRNRWYTATSSASPGSSAPTASATSTLDDSETPSGRIDLGDAVLRLFQIDDAEALAMAVWVSLEHLQPWMPWADSRSAEPGFQRERLLARGAVRAREEWQYGLFDLDDKRVLGSFGLMTRQGRARSRSATGSTSTRSGAATRRVAAATLTGVAFELTGVKHVLYLHRRRQPAQAAIPRKLGFDLLRIEDAPRSASSRTGRQQVWQRSTPLERTTPQ